MTETAVQARITGRVQGVSFRAWTQAEAEALDLAGWVRNRPDGSVEAMIQGPEDAVSRLLARLRKGPPAADVAEVSERSATPDPELQGFEIRT